MPPAEEVTPEKWENLQVLFDDGSYSVAAGVFEGSRSLGVRWNGSDDDAGFPNQGGNPLWHVVPDFLSEPILRAILEEELSDSSVDTERVEKIIQEFRGWKNK